MFPIVIAVQLLVPQGHMLVERGALCARAEELVKRGAIGVFNLVRLPGNELSRDFSDCGNPCFNIRGRDGLFLETILDRAAQAGVQDKLRVKIDLQTQTWATLKAAKVNVRQARPLYHTTGEVLDVISTPGLEQIARVLAFLVSRPTRRRRKGSTREANQHPGNASPRRQRVDRGLRGAAEEGAAGTARRQHLG